MQLQLSLPEMQAHTPEYVDRLNTGTLDAAAVRRIGFGELTREQVLIDRTKAEVAGEPQAVTFGSHLRWQAASLSHCC